MNLGVISDTHGYLDPRAIEFLKGSQRILHAGDIGDVAVLERLEGIAPVTAIRGNNDIVGPTASYPDELNLELGSARILLIHRLRLPRDQWDTQMNIYRSRGINLVVFGHSHKACVQWLGETLFFNPGSAGKRRFQVVPSVGLLAVGPIGIHGTIMVL